MVHLKHKTSCLLKRWRLVLRAFSLGNLSSLYKVVKHSCTFRYLTKVGLTHASQWFCLYSRYHDFETMVVTARAALLVVFRLCTQTVCFESTFTSSLTHVLQICSKHSSLLLLKRLYNQNLFTCFTLANLCCWNVCVARIQQNSQTPSVCVLVSSSSTLCTD